MSCELGNALVAGVFALAGVAIANLGQILNTSHQLAMQIRLAALGAMPLRF